MKKNNENYLKKKPIRADIQQSTDENCNVTLHIENKGLMNKIAQVLFKKPKVSYIHLDEFGSFVWNNIDGEKNIIEIGEEVRVHFGERAEPLYERLSAYIKTLESYRFIEFNVQ